MEAGSILVKRGLLSPQQLNQLRLDRPEATRLDVAAVDLGLVSEEAALRALGDEVGIPFVDLEQQKIDLSLLRGFPLKLIHRHSLFPLQRENGTLLVATSDPFDLYPLDELSATTGLTIEPVLAQREQIARLIKAHLGVGSETIDELMALQDEEDIQLLDEIDDDGELSEKAQEASVVRLVNEILVEAIERGPATFTSSRRPPASRSATASTACCSAAGAAGDQPLSGRDHQPPQDHGPAEHRRKAAAARRPHQAEGAGPRDRRPRFGHPHDPRRRHRHAACSTRGA